MRIPLFVHVALLAGAVFGCEETTHPPGAPPCESLAIDGGPSDGRPQAIRPCPVPATGGTPGGYRPPPRVKPGAWRPDGGSAPGREWPSAAGFGGQGGAAGLHDVGGSASCCG